MKRILIVNLHSAQNAGDHALLETALADLRRHLPDCAITLAANDPESFRGQPEAVVPSFFYWLQGPAAGRPLRLLSTLWLLLCSLPAALSYRLTGRALLWPIPPAQRPSVRAYFKAGVVASCPGNFLYSRSYQAGLPLLLTLYTIGYAWLAGKPIFLLPQTIGPIRRRWERLALAWLLKRVHLALVRDPISAALLAELGIPARSYRMLADMAFQPPTADSSPGRAMLAQFGIDPTQNGPLLGVTAIHWGAQDPSFTGQAAYEQALAETIQRFVAEEGGHAVIFAQVCGPKAADDDRIPARRIAQLLAATPAGPRVVVADGVFSPAVLRAAYAQMDFFIGSRLHSNIFALTEGTPVLAIAYQIKTWGVMQMLDLGEWVIDIDKVDGGRLAALYSRAWPQRQGLRREILPRVGRLLREREATIGAFYGAMDDALERENR